MANTHKEEAITKLVTLDPRKRVSLARIAETDTYRITKYDNGQIVLDPVHVLTDDDLAAIKARSARAGAHQRK